MFQRVTRIGLVAMSAAALWGADAGAQTFDGWGWFCCSEVTGEVDLSRVPNPNSKPSIVTVTGSLNSIEVICHNPNGREILPGRAGTRLVAAANAVGSDEITDRKRGLATVEILFGEEELRAAEEDAGCVNPLWSVIPGSAAPQSMSLTMQSFRCIPESNRDPEPCFQGDTDHLTVEHTPQDTVKLSCTLDPIRRDEDLRPLHNQEFTCIEQ